MSPLSPLCVPLLFAIGYFVAVDGASLPDHRIVGGAPVDIIDHPYQLTLQRNNDHKCGAAIISRKWAITAEHCVTTKKLSVYRLGAGSSHRYNSSTFYSVKRIVKHPTPLVSDIAVIEINGEFTYSENVQPVKLANQELKDGELVNVTGWGAMEDSGEDSDLLMGVTIAIVNHEECAKRYATMGAEVTEEMICAGVLDEGGKDACQGDSGGPLVANGVLYGIVSWGSTCASPRYPGVYSNVANLRPWVTRVTGI